MMWKPSQWLLLLLQNDHLGQWGSQSAEEGTRSCPYTEEGTQQPGAVRTHAGHLAGWPAWFLLAYDGHQPCIDLESVPLPYHPSLLKQKGLLGELSSSSLSSDSSTPRMNRKRQRWGREMVSKIQRALRSGYCFKPMTECAGGFCGSGALGQQPHVMGCVSTSAGAWDEQSGQECSLDQSCSQLPTLKPGSPPRPRGLHYGHHMWPMWLSSMSSSWCLQMAAWTLCLSEDAEEGQGLNGPLESRTAPVLR